MKKIINLIAITLLWQTTLITPFWQTAPAQPAKELITVYCHGVGGDKDQICDYQDQILQPCVSFNFPDTQPPTKRRNKFIAAQCAKIGKKYINREKMYMGQSEDVQAIHEQINCTATYILYGLCRGGMAIINYMAQYNPDNIAALVLDETPADIHDIIKKMQNHCTPLKLFSTETIMHRCFPGLRKNYKAPIHNIMHIKNKNLPIFLIYANQNTTFHFPSSTWKNYIAFKKAGFKHVYLCELKDNCQKAIGQDKILYLQALNSFYKLYKLPYKADYAIFDQQAMQKMQPTIQDIQKRLQDNKDLEKANVKKSKKNKVQ